VTARHARTHAISIANRWAQPQPFGLISTCPCAASLTLPSLPWPCFSLCLPLSGRRCRWDLLQLADDDDELFVVLPPSAVERGMKCGICAEEWWEMEEEEEGGARAPAAPSSAASAPSSLPSAASSSAASVAAAAAVPSSVSTCAQLYPSDSWPDPSLACVKLAKCAPGHACHRSCIGQWIKLKDHCPTCATKI